jgi:hypothetical protein
MSKVLDEPTRREAFLALVQLQDLGVAVIASREQIGAAFHIPVSLVQLIEREGLRKQWPPLNRDFAFPASSLAAGYEDLVDDQTPTKTE